MNVLIIFFASLAAVIVVLLLVALFVKKDYEVKKKIKISSPVPAVFEFIKYQKNQELYSKWVMTDPNARKTFHGTDGKPGFVYAWDSENRQMGKGEQEIKLVRENELVETEVRFERPFKGTSTTFMTTKPLGTTETEVEWGMRGTSKYPLNLMTLLMSGVLAKDLDESLHRLKSVMEKKIADGSR